MESLRKLPDSQPADPRFQRIAQKMAEGFHYLEDSIVPAYSLRGTFTSPDQRFEDAHARRYSELCEKYGRDNVYVDVKLGESPPHEGYLESEHTGFYVREPEIESRSDQ